MHQSLNSVPRKAGLGIFILDPTCNFKFFIKNNVISIPAIKGTLLPGITRKRIIEVAQCKGFKGNVISIPAIKGTLLPGITRKSVIEVAQCKGFQGLLFSAHTTLSGNKD